MRNGVNIVRLFCHSGHTRPSVCTYYFIPSFLSNSIVKRCIVNLYCQPLEQSRSEFARHLSSLILEREESDGSF